MLTVYQIKNLKRNKVYIGSSVNTVVRILEHFRDLSKMCHHNYLMQEDYVDDYEYFVWGVIQAFPRGTPRAFVYNWEQHILDTTADKYNILLGATDHIFYRTDQHHLIQRTRQLKLNL